MLQAIFHGLLDNLLNLERTPFVRRMQLSENGKKNPKKFCFILFVVSWGSSLLIQLSMFLGVLDSYFLIVTVIPSVHFSQIWACIWKVLGLTWRLESLSVESISLSSSRSCLYSSVSTLQGNKFFFDFPTCVQGNCQFFRFTLQATVLCRLNPRLRSNTNTCYDFKSLLIPTNSSSKSFMLLLISRILVSCIHTRIQL